MTVHGHPAARSKPATAPPDTTSTGHTRALWAQTPVLLAAQEPTSFGLVSFPFAWIEHEGGGKEAAKIPPAPGSPHTWTSIHLSTRHGSPDLRRRPLEMLLCGLAQGGGWSRNHRGSRSPARGLRAASPPTETFSLSSPYEQVQAILPRAWGSLGTVLNPCLHAATEL